MIINNVRAMVFFRFHDDGDKGKNRYNDDKIIIIIIKYINMIIAIRASSTIDVTRMMMTRPQLPRKVHFKMGQEILAFI